MDQTIILCCVVLFHCLIASCIATDQSSLLALKSSISYDPQNVITTNWSTSSHVCSWIGVSCSSRHERVTALDISDMSLEGRIPPELGNLSFLSSLRMSNNSFDGSLPHELANLRRLRLMDLQTNNFSGPFPSFLTSLPNLQLLHLTRNSFSGPIPTSIANLSKLEELGLGINFLEGRIPEEIGALTRLAYLNLEENKLIGPIQPIFNLSALQMIGLTRNYNLTGELPESICDKLPFLKGLYLTSNRLDGAIPSSLQKCKRLQVLSLSGNEFIGSIPRELGNLTSLKDLYLGRNRLRGSIPHEIGNLQKLEILGLHYNKLTGHIPPSIFNISSLQEFTSTATNLSGELPPNLGEYTPNLEYLYLGTNNLSGFLPASIANASRLRVLELVNNKLTGPIPDLLGNLEDLEILNLGVNQFINPSNSEFTFLTSLTKCRKLNKLLIPLNPLEGKLPTAIGNFSDSLTIFGASRCVIHGEIPQEIGNVTNLAMLSLFDNELIGYIPTSIARLQQLQRLYLNNNKISGFIPYELCRVGNLGDLDLSQNQILGTMPACIGDLTSLRNIHLDSNRLNSAIPAGIWRLKDILQFTASSNMLYGQIPQEIGNMKAAILIDLSMNNLTGRIPATIGGAQSLINLSLADNGLEGPVPDALGTVLSLESLDLSHNYLTGVIPESLRALIYLRFLNVSFNKLHGEIPNGGPFANFTLQSFMSNEALCGDSRFQVSKCRSSSPNRPRRRRRVLHIALYTTSAFGVISIALIGFVLLKCQKKRKGADQTLFSPDVLSPRISYNELQEATDGFSKSNVLGIGGYSSVYKGILKNGTAVAVKVFNIELEGAFKSFDVECDVLRSLRHRNLAKVISSCSNTEFRALVLEYMPNGSLEKWLHSRNCVLDIMQRLNIVIDVASALDYLHSGFIMPVVHCDLKPSNVLLDNELVGHVSDFGISKMLSEGENAVYTRTLATIGYIAPEYGVEGIVSTRSDVYSYGILLMETFSRRRPCDEMFAEELSMRQWIKDSIPSEISRVIDSDLAIEGGDLDAKLQCVLSVMEVALKCSEEVPEMRISMKDVATMLNKIKLQFLASCGRIERKRGL